MHPPADKAIFQQMPPLHLGSLGSPLLAGSMQSSLHLPLLQAPPQPAAAHDIYWPHLQLAVLHRPGHALSQQLATLCRHQHVPHKQLHLQLAKLHTGTWAVTHRLLHRTYLGTHMSSLLCLPHTCARALATLQPLVAAIKRQAAQ